MRNDSEMLSNLLDTLEVYRATWLLLQISIKEIDAQETGLGLIGPRNGRLSRLLETLFGWSSTFPLHALLHDVFGRIYLKLKKGPGYTYVFRNCIFKGSPHLTRPLSCILFRKNIGRIIVNKI